ncbi:recombinase family protein [Klebsiella pneumoniae]|uniref:recombinase family protein n=1 Tax=Klebsiella pneumoniae TaxID=573 RepID=UPI0003BE0F88|nr:recombinase family protein [Klebsiella pneumoniae]EIV6998946.1 recombinase family protein [Klebsiella pneumoniae]EKT8191556.1 recombinase family protein [Klebsiella pneumoniae]EKT8263696.1 recombinase family protein [Klebsiella pneumoniae]EKT8274369.1 recombinase family protein [Klebsiella pneumoniae]EKT8448480.1 recombinase family protein [Klebsiella pneumoniae]
MPQLYSYIRWSTDRQDKGTTRNRQLAAAKVYAAEAGLEMVEIEDPGVSAFRGKNTNTGKLGDFIDAVKQGAIASDSWLYVENLDRITRQNVTTAQKLFIELLELGLTLVTGMDKRVYTLDSVNKNPTELMISLLLFSRANEESETKSNRTIGNVVALVERHQAGLPVNIKSVGRHPFWIDDSGSQYEAVKEHPVYWSIAREAIDMFLDGNGIYTVKRYLDEKYPNGLKGKEWDYQVLKKMRDNRALIGERTINVGGATYKLDNYYPWLCKDEAEFLTLAERKQQNNYKAKKDKTEEIKLLSGLQVLRCSKCGGTMHSFMNHGSARYICTNGVHLQKNCSGWSISAQLVEHCTIISLLIGYMDKSRKDGIDTTAIEEEISRKEILITDLESRIANMAQAIAIAPDVSALAVQLNTFDLERKKTVLEVDKLKERLHSLKGKGSLEVDITDFLMLIQWSVFTNMEDADRNKIRKIISSIIESIIVEKADGCITIKIKCHHKDEWLVFGGVNRKPFWAFTIEYSTNDAKEIEGGDSSNFVSNTLFQKAVEQLDSIKQSYLKLFETANTMLGVVGYSDIRGASFWPNTGQYERANVEYEGITYSIAMNGRVSKAITAALEATGLSRKDFIERYKV